MKVPPVISHRGLPAMTRILSLPFVFAVDTSAVAAELTYEADVRPIPKAYCFQESLLDGQPARVISEILG